MYRYPTSSILSASTNMRGPQLPLAHRGKLRRICQQIYYCPPRTRCHQTLLPGYRRCSVRPRLALCQPVFEPSLRPPPYVRPIQSLIFHAWVEKYITAVAACINCSPMSAAAGVCFSHISSKLVNCSSFNDRDRGRCTRCTVKSLLKRVGATLSAHGLADGRNDVLTQPIRFRNSVFKYVTALDCFSHGCARGRGQQAVGSWSRVVSNDTTEYDVVLPTLHTTH